MPDNTPNKKTKRPDHPGNENKRAVGTRYEHIAARYLKLCGYEILEHNYRTRYAEIDIIAKSNDYLCFIEVKYRSSFRCGLPSEAVDPLKQRNILSAARAYIAEHQLYDLPIRFDIVEIVGEQIRIIPDCFGQ